MNKTYKKITRKQAIAFYHLGVQFQCDIDGFGRFEDWYMDKSDGWGPHMLGKKDFPLARTYTFRVEVE